MSATGRVRSRARAGRRLIDQAEFVARESSVELVRRFVGESLAGFAGLDDAVLCVSELAANAVKHGSKPGGRFRVTARKDCGRAHVAVIDSGCGTWPELLEPDLDAETSRGLMVVNVLATRWGWAPTLDGGRRVWFQLDAKCAGR